MISIAKETIMCSHKINTFCQQKWMEMKEDTGEFIVHTVVSQKAHLGLKQC